jgi:hypothetical protein
MTERLLKLHRKLNLALGARYSHIVLNYIVLGVSDRAGYRPELGKDYVRGQRGQNDAGKHAPGDVRGDEPLFRDILQELLRG